MDQNNKFFEEIKDYTVYSISPFYHLDVEDGVTSRISFIHSQLSEKTNRVITIMRGRKNKNSLFDSSTGFYFGSQNKFIHLFDPKILFFMKAEIFKIDKPILYVHTIWCFFYAIFFRIFFGIPYVFDNHNVEFDRFYSTRRFLLLPFIFLMEMLLIYFSKYVIVGSDLDKNRLVKLYGNGALICVLPMQIEKKQNLDRTEILKKYGIPGDKIKLLFFASFSYGPNKEALSYIQDSIIPFLPSNYIFILCGKDLHVPTIFNDRAAYLGYVENIDDLIYISDCVVAPIFSGGGVKTKILHAMSYNKNIITTQEGLRGINFENYTNMQIACKDDFLLKILNFSFLFRYESS